MKLYQYAIILHPTKKEREDESKKSEVIVGVTTVLAPDEQAATLVAGRAIPETHLDKLDQIEVAIRPF